MRKNVQTLPLVAVMSLLALLVAAPVQLHAQSVGGGISVFVPWDMFQGETGSISFETSLETSIGLGKHLSFPVGFAYNQVYGLSPGGEFGEGEAATEVLSGGPWFYADSIVPYLMAKVHIPIGPVYVDLFGGGAANFNFSMRPLHDRIARDLRANRVIGDGVAASDPVAVTNLEVDSGLGFGFLFGTGVGVTIGDIQVGLKGTYRHIFHPLKVSGQWFAPGSSGTETFTIEDEALRVVLQGVSIGVGGSFSF